MNGIGLFVIQSTVCAEIRSIILSNIWKFHILFAFRPTLPVIYWVIHLHDRVIVTQSSKSIPTGQY